MEKQMSQLNRDMRSGQEQLPIVDQSGKKQEEEGRDAEGPQRIEEVVAAAAEGDPKLSADKGQEMNAPFKETVYAELDALYNRARYGNSFAVVRLEEMAKTEPLANALLIPHYFYGTGATKRAYEARSLAGENVSWLRNACDETHPQFDRNILKYAQFVLAICLLEGLGMEKDVPQHVPYFKASADQGYANAQFNLGVSYANGNGVAKDEVEAVKLYRLAADQGHANGIHCLALLPSSGGAGGQRAVSGSDDKALIIWDLAERRAVMTLRGHTDYVISVVCPSPDRIVSGSVDNSIRLWDAISGACLREMKGHTGSVYSLVMLSNDIIASGSSDKTIGIWQLSTGQRLQILTGHGFCNSLGCLAVMKDGRLVAGSYDEILHIWN